MSAVTPTSSPRAAAAIGLTLALVTATAAGVAQAQTPPSAAGNASAPPAVGPGIDPSPRADNTRGATLTARYHVRQMENVFERAVQHAADMMRRRLQAITPDVLAIAGSPRAQGFRIDGYGLFFSVEIPRLSESVNWALRVLSQDRDERVLVSLQKVASSEQDPAVRADLERAIRTVQLQLSMVPKPPAAASAQRRPAPPQAPAELADRAGAPPTPTPQGGAPVSAAAPAPPAEVAVADAMVDPSAAYEDEVKQALVDAMLDYAGSIQLPVSEWVTIAARDAGYVAFPDTVSDMVTVTLSVRVSDLLDFRAQRLTRDQARARVVMKEF